MPWPWESPAALGGGWLGVRAVTSLSGSGLTVAARGAGTVVPPVGARRGRRASRLGRHGGAAGRWLGSCREPLRIAGNDLAAAIEVVSLACLVGLYGHLAGALVVARYCAQGSGRAASRADSATWPAVCQVASGSHTGPAGLVCSGSMAAVAIRNTAAFAQAASPRRAVCSRRGVRQLGRTF